MKTETAPLSGNAGLTLLVLTEESKRDWGANTQRSLTRDVEGAAQGPQVQLSQAERHLMAKESPSCPR